MTVLRLRGIALPAGETVDLYADGDRWTTDPVHNAELVGEGWLALAATGMSAHAALGAGSWDARAFLRPPGLVDGAPADAVLYPQDPRAGPAVPRPPSRGHPARPNGPPSLSTGPPSPCRKVSRSNSKVSPCWDPDNFSWPRCRGSRARR